LSPDKSPSINSGHFDGSGKIKMEISLRRATIKDVDILLKLESQLGEVKTYVKSNGKEDIEEEINIENYFGSGQLRIKLILIK